MDKKKFIEQYFPIIKKVGTAEKVSDVIMVTCLTQAAIESGFASSALMVKANALFGIKATDKYKGKVYSSATKEVYSGLTVTTKALFRAYDNVEDSIKDYFKLLKSKRYEKCLEAKTVPEAINIIANSGYATDINYAIKCIKVYDTFIKGSISLLKLGVDTVNADVSDEEITKLAYDVIAGKYGNGEARKKALGTNYVAVQHKVNILLRGGK